MKVIFLDFDGVLNTFTKFSKGGNFSIAACKNLMKVLNNVPEARIVVSSAWRHSGLDFVRDILAKNGIPTEKVIDVTEQGNASNRAKQISNWLSKNGNPVHAIIDDESHCIDADFSKFVKTNSWIGLTEKDADKAISILQVSP